MEPKQAVEYLMNDGITFAKQMLSEYGEFHPYARALGADLEIVNVDAYDGDELPSGSALLQLLEDGLREKVNADGDLAIATFTNVTLRNSSGDPVDTVQVGLEHASGYAVNVYYPYSISDQGINYGNLIAMQRDPNIFDRTDC
jgi:hypothetical protein